MLIPHTEFYSRVPNIPILLLAREEVVSSALLQDSVSLELTRVDH